MNRPIRWGVMGTGWVAKRFMADLSKEADCELAAVASRSASRALEHAEAFGASRPHSSYESLVQDPHVDVVYIATEHHQHAEHCKLALTHGKHVLCEKPFAISSAQVEEIVEVARTNNVFCMEAMWSRFLPGMLEAKRRVESGAIGFASMITADFGNPVLEQVGSRFFDPARGGGALLDRGVYAISLATWLFGKPKFVLSAADVHPTGVDRSVMAILGFSENRLAHIVASIGSQSSNQAVIAGTNGRVVLREPFYRPEAIECSRYEPVAITDGSNLKARSPREIARRAFGKIRPYLPASFPRARMTYRPVRGYGYGYEAAEVVRCLREGLRESPIMPLGDSLIVVNTMEQIRAQLGPAAGLSALP